VWYDEYHEANDVVGFKNEARTTMLFDPAIDETEFTSLKKEDVVQRVVDAAEEYYDRKESMLGPDFMGALERIAALRSIDDEWRDHLRSMDDLKEGIYLRAYGQKDPILEYKQEAYKVFLELITQINKSTINFAFKYYPQVVEQRPTEERVSVQQPQPAERPALPQIQPTVTPTRRLQFSHPSTTSTSLGADPNAQPRAQESDANTIRNVGREVGRNEPCPCGSGKKFKACHGANGETTYPA
jgi:preprotein translocase subunit SecA